METVARVRPRQRAEREQPHHESNVGRHASTVARAPGRGLRGARWCRGRDRARGGRRGVLAAPAVAVRGRRRPGSVPQIRREARIVQPPAVEPGGELAESRGVDAARVRRGGPRDDGKSQMGESVAYVGLFVCLGGLVGMVAPQPAAVAAPGTCAGNSSRLVLAEQFSSKFGRFGVLRCPRQSRCHHV